MSKKKRKSKGNPRNVNVTPGLVGFQRRQPKAANPSDAGTSVLSTVDVPTTPTAPSETSSTALPIGNVWSEYVKLGEAKKAAPPAAAVAERKPVRKKSPASDSGQRRPASDSRQRTTSTSAPARKRPPVTKQTTTSYYGKQNAYHAQTRMEITRAIMLLARMGRRNVFQSIPELVQAIHRVATLIHQHDPRIHGGEPNVMSDRARATAAWIVNNKEKELVVTDPQSGKKYLDPHASRLLLTAETDLKKNPALQEAHEKGKPVQQGDLVFSR